MTELKWYFTSLPVASRAAGEEHLARWYHCLLTAIGHDDAYAKATVDGAVLWSEDLSATTSELERLIPNKSLLGVFEWEEQQLHRA